MSRLSIVVTCYNQGKLIAGMLPSLLDDLAGDDEVIIADDGSSDGSLDDVRHVAAADTRVRLLPSPPTRSVSRTRNRGFRATTGDWVCFLDGDDYYLPGRRELLAEGFRLNPTPRVVFTDSFSEQIESGTAPEQTRWMLRGMQRRLLDGRGQQQGNWFALSSDVFGRILADIGAPPQLAACAFHRLALVEAQLAFDTRLAVAEDTDFVLRAAADGGVFFSLVPTFVARRSESGLDSRKDEAALLSRMFCALSLTRHPLFTSDSEFANNTWRRIAEVEGDIAYVLRRQGSPRRAIRHAVRSLAASPSRLALLELVKSALNGLIRIGT
jgi:glycosyltransferase involved in cell wall biosynthesis